MPVTDKAKCAEYQREWRKKNPEAARAIDARKREKSADKIAQYWEDCKEKRKTDPEFQERERGYRETVLAKSPEGRQHEYRRRALFRYGLTPEQYDSMLAEQENKCAICGTEHVDEPKKRLHVDHDHAAGFKAVRGLLCGKCNLGIGMFGEDQDRLIKAIEYLKGFQK